MKSSLLFWMLFLGTLSCTRSLSAQRVIELDALKDNTIYARPNNHANGAGANLIAGANNQGNIRRALIQFDLAPLEEALMQQAGEISRVEIRLEAIKGNGLQEIKMHALARPWGEGEEDAADAGQGRGVPADSGSATWVNSGLEPWSQSGGDFRDTPSARFSIDSLGAWTIAQEGLRDDLIAWLQGAAYHGWMLVGNEVDSGTTWHFSSREGLVAPVMEVTLSSSSRLDDAPQGSSPRAYPNPARDAWTLADWPSHARSIWICNSTGQKVFERTLPPHGTSMTVDVRDWNRGVYHVHIVGAPGARQRLLLR